MISLKHELVRTLSQVLVVGLMAWMAFFDPEKEKEQPAQVPTSCHAPASSKLRELEAIIDP